MIGALPTGVRFSGGAGVDAVRLLNFPSASVLDNGAWTDIRAGAKCVSFDAGSVESLTVSGTAAADTYRVAAGALVAVGAASFVINLVGALYGTMFCDVTHYAFLHYADAIRHRHFFSFPLLGIEGQAPY